MWRNSEARYGLVAMSLHWLVAVLAIALFGLGLWMVELTYYDAWYRTAPWIHKSLGVLVFIGLLTRLLWRTLDPPPPPEATLNRFEHLASRLVHALLYLLLFGITISGYLISTADGKPVEVFGLFSVPATLTGLPGQADRAGDLHLVLAISLMVFASIHALAALKHHFIDRDRTLLRMFGRTRG